MGSFGNKREEHGSGGGVETFPTETTEARTCLSANQRNRKYAGCRSIESPAVEMPPGRAVYCGTTCNRRCPTETISQAARHWMSLRSCTFECDQVLSEQIAEANRVRLKVEPAARPNVCGRMVSLPGASAASICSAQTHENNRWERNVTNNIAVVTQRVLFVIKSGKHTPNLTTPFSRRARGGLMR